MGAPAKQQRTGAMKYPGMAYDECCKCLNSMDRKEWAKLGLCYMIFYGCLAAWFSVHLYVMVDNLPNRYSGSSSGTEFQALTGVAASGTATMRYGEASYWGFAELAVTLANQFDGSGVPSATPWEEDKPPAVSVSSTTNEAYQQIRINNYYDLAYMRADQQVTITCEAQSAGLVTWSDLQNPFFGVSYTSGATTAGVTVTTTNTGKDAITVVFGEGAIIPHVVQFKMTRNGANTGTDIPFTCSTTGNGKSYKDCPNFSVRFGQ